MNKLVRFAAVALAVTIAMALYVASPRSDTAQEGNRKPSDQTAIHPGLSARQEGPWVAASERAESNTSSAELRKRFFEARDLRVFAEYAGRLPLQGGLFYARQALLKCYADSSGKRAQLTASLRYRSNEDGVSYQRRIEAVGLLSNRCASFAQGEVAQQLQQNTSQFGVSSGDPLDRAQLALASIKTVAASSPDELQARGASIEQILGTKDPLLLDDTRLTKIMLHKESGQEARLWFDGRAYLRSDADWSNISAAMMLVACGLGNPCDGQDDLVLALCAYEGRCHSNRFEYVKAELAGGSAETMQAILSFQQKMVQSILKNDVKVFMPLSNQPQ